MRFGGYIAKANDTKLLGKIHRQDRKLARQSVGIHRELREETEMKTCLHSPTAYANQQRLRHWVWELDCYIEIRYTTSRVKERV